MCSLYARTREVCTKSFNTVLILKKVIFIGRVMFYIVIFTVFLTPTKMKKVRLVCYYPSRLRKSTSLDFTTASWTVPWHSINMRRLPSLLPIN